MEEIDVKKTKYFVIAIIILIILSIILIVHFNNKKMVNGSDEDTIKTTTKSDIIPITTTITTTTTKRVKINTEKKETKEENIVELERVETIYKSTIDENNNLVYNYKLTDEINNTDSIISTKLSISEELKNKNIISLYDISLYDETLNKKTVNNSLINIKIPIKDELIGYDEYKVIYINDNSEIIDEEFNVKIENNYIEFETTHLSIFGIIGIKNVVEEIEPEKNIDLSKLEVKLSINDLDYIYNPENILLLSKDDKLNIKVENINYEYKIYYSLSITDESDFKELNYTLLKDIDNKVYNLKIKVVVENEEKIFEFGKVSVYDIVYTNNDEETLEPIGVIKNEDGTIYIPENEDEYLYDDKELNKDIVIDNGDKIIVNKTEEKEQNQEEVNIDNNQNNSEVNNNETDNTEINDNVKTEETKEKSEVKIKIKGNIYLVEETDISNLEMTGYLIIDTSENITFENFDVFTNLYTITIRSKIFTFNGREYTYEYNGDKVIIKKHEKLSSEENLDDETKEVEVSIEDFKSIFNKDFNELVIENKIIENIDQDSKEEKKSEQTAIENNGDETISKEIITG